MLKKISPKDTSLGMYVQSFEGNWLTQPFWRAHFLITSTEELSKIRSGNARLVIDTAKGKDVSPVQPPAMRAASSSPVKQFGRADKARAADLAQRSSTVVKALFDDCRLGKNIDSADILTTVDEIADDLIHNLSAFITVTRLKARDDHSYTHSIAVCALMISLARELGAPPATVREFGMAGLLHDIGKVVVPEAILLKPGALTAEEMLEVRRHPACGHEILTRASGVPPVVLDVCLHHHERLDGEGYPFGLTGDAISRAARMASVCDVYDAMTSVRCYKKGMSALQAITAMDASTGQFDGKILFGFMRQIGVYPPGKLVRLQCNRLALTLPSHRHTLGQVFRAFYSTTETRFIRYEDIILSDGPSDDDTVRAEDPEAWFSAAWPDMAARIIQGQKVEKTAGFTDSSCR